MSAFDEYISKHLPVDKNGNHNFYEVNSVKDIWQAAIDSAIESLPEEYWLYGPLDNAEPERNIGRNNMIQEIKAKLMELKK